MGVYGRVGRDLGTGLGIGAAGLAAAGAIGWLAAQGDPGLALIAIAPAAAVLGLFLAARPLWLLWGAVLGGLVISGLFRLYLPQLQMVRWALPPIAILLTLYAIWGTPGFGPNRGWRPVPNVIWWALGFFAAVILAGALSEFLPSRFLVGFKGYFQVWGLLIALAFIPWPANVIDRLPRVFLVIAFLQLPFVLHQYLFLVPARVHIGNGIVPIDVVAGSFGASMQGGGANAVLNAFLAMVIAGVIAARQLNVISTTRLFLLSAPLTLPIFVNEAKVSIFYLLAVFAVLFGKDLIERPLRFLLALLPVSLVLIALMTSFALHAPSTARVESIPDLIRFTYEYNIENEEVGDELSRFGGLRFWIERHGLNDLAGTLVGHGIGYTRVAEIETPYRETTSATTDGIPVVINLKLNIGNTAVTALLWETGLLGLLLILGLLAATYRSAGRLERAYADIPERAAVLRAVRPATVIILITLAHKNVLVFDIAYQTLLMIIIGYVAYWERQAGVQVPPITSNAPAIHNGSRPNPLRSSAS
ncbi:hypothetical protein [uncultured Lamprocystis sp.]|jgi:hypothetical protein|uniref:hypothetical protein n=1 Tax=uncultured Lamprocystis sp. TaxID=543132 RepID=UPI0025FC1D50|nr:hypothetical protein [uncultured Lamprocystis sp.]